ncbi:MAG: hypothetical protein QOE70_6472 [Chthoniobacter sp.]|jgi:amino acid adenylation domain-containing protein|nr:hypothetical protein [Chthoniobacter sp.]
MVPPPSPIPNVASIRHAAHRPLNESERHKLLFEWNQDRLVYPPEACVHQLFEAQVQRTPEAVALIAGDERLTFRELNCRANQLAHHLGTRGVGPETLVGICCERSWRMMVGVLAVLKAGGAYVPLDPAYPRDRLAFMLEDTKAPLLLATHSSVAVQPPPGTSVVWLDSDWPEIEKHGRDNPAGSVRSANLAYVLYTSGSTGKPKGVALEHRGAVALLHWAREVFNAEEISGVLASTSICFDLSVFEMFVPLSWGGCVILADNALALPELAAREEVTLINTVPSAARELLLVTGIPASVRVVNLAGEPLAATLVNQLYGETAVQKVYDLYGPTETTTYSTYTLREPGHPPTIGRPLSNEQVYLLDPHHQLVPIGAPGELYIGGDGLARGYLNRPDLTQEKFVPHPFKPGERLYKTGDLGRWRVDGNLEYLGRIDHQIKIRGFRVELGEIEATLAEHPGVRACAVVAREIPPLGLSLVGYIVPQEQARPSTHELRDFLKQRLPDHMVPGMYVPLAALPLSPRGKVDRQALPPPEVVPSPDHGEAPLGDATEQKIKEIWESILQISRIGLQDSFFDLGGHSLLAFRVIAAINRTFDVSLEALTLFEHPTIEKLARIVAGAKHEPTVPKLIAGPRAGTGRPVVFVFHNAPIEAFRQAHVATRPEPFLVADVSYYTTELLGRCAQQDCTTLPSVADMAVPHTSLIHNADISGPLLLAGYSYGGVLAVEVAHQLICLGRTIEAVLLFDSSLPDWKSFKAPLQAPIPPRIDLADPLARWSVINRIWLHALQWYRPQPLASRGILFRAERRVVHYENDDFDNCLGWSQFFEGGLQIVRVPGTHMSMWQEPDIHELIRAWNTSLDALSGAAATP